MKNVIIVGAGITGLSAGINALLKGHNVVIYEKNNFSGGCCSGWYKNNYYIDNCMHWLTGTNQHTKLFKLWKKLGAIDETSNLYQGSCFYKSYYNGESISLTCNTEKVRNAMIKISPEDRKEIDKFINAVNYFIKTNKKINFICDLFNKTNGCLKTILRFHRLSLGEYAKRFKHPLLQKLFTDYIPSNYSTLSLICAYSTFASGNGKIYSDGSSKFAKNIEKRFLDLGGCIYYNSEVTKINIENNKFKSIVVNNEIIEGDILISCIDAYYLFDKLLSNDYLPKILNTKQAYKKQNPIISSFQCAYLVNKKDLHFKDTIIFDIPKIQVGLSVINRLVLKEYSYLDNKSDKVVIQAFIVQNMIDYDYWQQLHSNNCIEYNNIKNDLGLKIMDVIIGKNNKFINNIELLDTWTPITYNSYFNSYYGSYMGYVLLKGANFKKLSPKIDKIKNLYYLSYWQNTFGGLPVAAQLGESISKYL